MNLHEEINRNMTVSAGGGFALNNDELESLRNNQVWTNSRANRRNGGKDKPSPRTFAQEWINTTNLVEPNNSNIVVQQWPVDENQVVILNGNQNNQMNNKNSCEDIDTLRENIRNSKESLRKSSSENILDIEENMRKNSLKSTNNKPTDNNLSGVQLRNNPSTLRLANKSTSDGTDTGGSMADIYQSPTSPTAKDPHSAYIDLSNNCRQFYFNHVKTAEAIKMSLRTSKHNRSLDKVQGKQSSGIDNAMDRLRTEMADLMEQDLSLMSQLLTLNDKIEEIKFHVRNSAESFSQSLSYLSNGDFTDNEFSDLEESGIFNRDFSVRRNSVALNASSKNFTTKQGPAIAIPETETEPEVESNDAKPRKIEPSEREIIVYRKKKSKRKDRSGKARSRSSSSTEDSDTNDEESDVTSDTNDDGSESDTDSTLSCHSSNSASESLTETESKEKNEKGDSGIQSPTQSKEPEVTKPVKGGVSRNRFFLKFHKKNGVSDAIPNSRSVITLQGHHIPLEKYYIPQGLVYLKHTESDNVFCQFSH